MANAWTQMREMHRVAVNAWIRESGVFDGVADFDAALRDLKIPTQMRAVDDCGDGLHPSERRLLQNGRRDRPRAIRLEAAVKDNRIKGAVALDRVANEGSQQQVTINKPFAVSKFELILGERLRSRRDFVTPNRTKGAEITIT